MIKWRWFQPVDKDALCLQVIRYDGEYSYYLDSNLKEWIEFPPHSTVPSTLEIPGVMSHLFPSEWTKYPTQWESTEELLTKLRELVTSFTPILDNEQGRRE